MATGDTDPVRFSSTVAPDNYGNLRLMRSKNSKPIDPLERAYMADVKSVRCVFCDASPPVEAHHVKQGRHFCTVAACKPCHDAKAWRLGKPNEFDAVNETRRRVEQLRSGAQVHPRRNTISVPAPKRKGSALTSSKIIPRAA